MYNIPTKTDGISTLSADEFNKGYIEDLENAVTKSGISLDTVGAPTNQNMLAEAITKASQSGQSFQDSGTANSYILTPIGGYQQSSVYFDGMIVGFEAGNTNTGNSTINVNSIGVKNLRNSSGGAIGSGEIQSGSHYDVKYDLGNDRFTLLNPSTDSSSSVPYNARNEITISNSTGDSEHDILFSGGNFFLNDGVRYATALPETKRIDATFVDGDGNGGLDTGTVAADTWYYCYVISNTGGTNTGYLFTATFDSPTMPSGFTQFSYVGAIQTDASANIIPEFRVGNKVYRKTPTTDVLSFSVTDSATLHDISVPPIDNIIADVSCYAAPIVATTFTYGWLLSPLADDLVPSISSSNIYCAIASNAFQDNHMHNLQVPADNGQIRSRFNGASLAEITINTISYTDNNL